jgi:hypothetical protein
MARYAQALAVLDRIPLAALTDRHDVIGLGFSLVGTDTAAGTTLPRITGEHGLTPRSVPLVAVPTLGRRRTIGFVTATASRQSGGLVRRDALRHW